METPTNSGPAPGPSAASAVAPDPKTAELLEKRAAGHKLTPGEYGTLGAFARWLKNGLGKGGAAAQPAGTASPAGKSPAVAAVAPGQAPADSLEPVEIDDGLCQRTAAALLTRADTAIVGKVDREARATCDALKLIDAEREKILTRFRRSSGLSAGDQRLIVDLSPDVCRELGIDPRQFALWTVGGVLGLHAWNIWQAIDELKELRRERPTASEPARTPTDPSAPKPTLTPKAPADGLPPQ
jgi:hypothetical protein